MVLLFSLLLGTGVGSLYSARLRKNLARAVIAASFLAAALSVSYRAFLPTLFSLRMDARLIATLASLPLGFFLGFPFPLAIRPMDAQHLSHLVHWMCGLNRIASVLGSALAMIIGILMALFYAVYAGVLLYGGVALLMLRVARPVAAP